MHRQNIAKQVLNHFGRTPEAQRHVLGESYDEIISYIGGPLDEEQTDSESDSDGAEPVAPVGDGSIAEDLHEIWSSEEELDDRMADDDESDSPEPYAEAAVDAASTANSSLGRRNRLPEQTSSSPRTRSVEDEPAQKKWKGAFGTT